MAAGGFGVLEFQLMLLRRMADFQPGLVEDAVRALGAGPRSVAGANRRWQAMIRSRTFPGGLTRYRIVLGAPAAAFTQPFGDLDSEVTRWRLPLWPDLRFEIISVPGGPVLQQWLVRPDPGTRPVLRTAADAEPWSCVVADVHHAFPGARHEDGDAPTRWGVVFTAPPHPGAAPARHLASFTWGLLQQVTRI